jgi:rhodanese-related sulfurtransferase
MKRSFQIWVGVLSVTGFAGILARADVTPAELEQRLARGEKITVIDVRSTSLFQRGHIANAINIPVALVPAKQLPPIGTVVVYDGGLGLDETTEAVAALNRKPGIRAEAMAGGFAAWEDGRGSSTRSSGVQAEELPMITYDDLKKAQSQQVILVDLRKRPAQPLQRAATEAPIPPLTDLQQVFPKVGAVTRSPFDLPQQRQGADAVPPLLVLIDNGNGADAQAMARTLRANGARRVVILAGGEEILARGGQAGLQRIGSTLELPQQQK